MCGYIGQTEVHTPKKRHTGVRLFPMAAGGRLTLKSSLLATLEIDRQLLLASNPNTRRSTMRKTIHAFELAWKEARAKVTRRSPHFVEWLRQLLKEAFKSGFWVPNVMLKRLRQLQRGEIQIHDSYGQLELIAHEGLPSAFCEATDFMAQRFWIVPHWDGKYVNICRNDEDCSELVEAVCTTWRNRPRELGKKELRSWISSELKEQGWKIS